MHVIRITAAQIADLQARHAMGKIEEALLQLAGDMKRRSRRRSVLVRLDFPGSPEGGITLQCARPKPGWLARLLWRWTTIPLPLWEGQ